MTDETTGSDAASTGRLELAGWAAAALALMALAIPWFLWRSDAVAAGLPLWIWWHVGWMILAAGVFYAFTRRGWGVGVHATEGPGDDDADVAGAEEVHARG